MKNLWKKVKKMNNEQIKKLTKKDYEQFKNVLYVFKEAPWYAK